MLSANYLYIHFNKQKIFPCFNIAKFLLLFTQEKNSVTDFLVSSWDIQNITAIFRITFTLFLFTVNTPLLVRFWMNQQGGDYGGGTSTGGDCLKRPTLSSGAFSLRLLNTPPGCRLLRFSRDTKTGHMCLYTQLYMKAQPFQRVSFPPVPSKK